MATEALPCPIRTCREISHERICVRKLSSPRALEPFKVCNYFFHSLYKTLVGFFLCLFVCVFKMSGLSVFLLGIVTN